jgi:hypothetical protein
LSATFAAGCFSPTFTDGSLQCTADRQCPPGYHCADNNTCWSGNKNPDMSAPDQSVPDGGASDLGDIDGSADSAAPDLAKPAVPTSAPPASVWTSCGGGAGAGSASAAQGTFSIGGSIVVGRSTAASGADVSFGYFSDDLY